MDKNFITIQTKTINGKLLLLLAKVNFRFMLLPLIFLGFSVLTWGQTTLYTGNFGTVTSFPTGWSTSGTLGWTINNSVTSTGYPNASAGSNAMHFGTNTSYVSGTLTFNNNLSTVGYSNITVLWSGRRNVSSVQSPTFEYSVNGTTWTAVAFTDVATDGNWYLVNGGSRILLTNASGVSNLRFRWTHSASNAGSYRLDDFSVQGTLACPTITATVDSKSDITCFNNNDGSITVSATGGIAPYTFSKDNGANYETVNNLPSAGKHTFSGLSANEVYRIRVKDANNCESTIIP